MMALPASQRFETRSRRVDKLSMLTITAARYPQLIPRSLAGPDTHQISCTEAVHRTAQAKPIPLIQPPFINHIDCM